MFFRSRCSRFSDSGGYLKWNSKKHGNSFDILFSEELHSLERFLRELHSFHEFVKSVGAILLREKFPDPENLRLPPTTCGTPAIQVRLTVGAFLPRTKHIHALKRCQPTLVSGCLEVECCAEPAVDR